MAIRNSYTLLEVWSMSETYNERTLSHFEKMGGTYIQCGDYLIPNLSLPEQKEYDIGVWGMQYIDYMKEHHKALYYSLRNSCKLHEHVYETERRARNMFDDLVEHYTKKRELLSNLNLLMLWNGFER